MIAFALHLYHWHPYELQATIGGMMTGAIVGIKIDREIHVRRRRGR